MANATATLSSHNSDHVTREDLLGLSAPEETRTFKPVSHHTLVSALDATLAKAGIRVLDEQLALRRDGQMLFGVFKLAYGTTDAFTSAIGFRAANDKSMSIQICAGLSVFVCDNMCFRGDMIALNRKHTSGLMLNEELEIAVLKFLEHSNILHEEVGALQTRTLSDIQAKEIVYDIFAQDLVPARYFANVHQQYFEPQHPEFQERTAWSLHNAFTEVVKPMPLTTRLPAIQRIGRHFGLVSTQAPQAQTEESVL